MVSRNDSGVGCTFSFKVFIGLACMSEIERTSLIEIGYRNCHGTNIYKMCNRFAKDTFGEQVDQLGELD